MWILNVVNNVRLKKESSVEKITWSKLIWTLDVSFLINISYFMEGFC